MPTLTVNSRTANIHQSVVKWAEAEIVTGVGLVLSFEDSDGMLDPNNMPDQWGDLSTIRLSPQTISQRSGEGKRASRVEYLVNINLFENRDASARTLYSLRTLADQVSELLEVPASITIRDYQTVGTPIVGALQAVQSPDMTQLPKQLVQGIGINQINVSSRMNYISESVD